jgi:hypothetical protein
VGNLDIEWTSEHLTFGEQTSRKAASRVCVIFWAFSRSNNIAKEFFLKSANQARQFPTMKRSKIMDVDSAFWISFLHIGFWFL